MSYCPVVVKNEKCVEEKTQWEQAMENLKSPKCAFAVACAVGLAGFLTPKNPKPLVYAVVGGSLAASFYTWHRKTDEDILQRHTRPCTTIFDTYRFTTHPVCYTMPREQPLLFYDNEPDKPVSDSTWTENFAYDNVPKPDCCMRLKVQAAISKNRQSEDYGNLPSSGQCPKKQ